MGYSTSSSSSLYLVFFISNHYKELTELKIQEMVNIMVSGEAYRLNVQPSTCTTQGEVFDVCYCWSLFILLVGVFYCFGFIIRICASWRVIWNIGRLGLEVWYWFVVVKIIICISSLFVDNKKGKRCWRNLGKISTTN